MSIIIPGSPLDMMVVKFANPMPQLLFDMLVASGWRVVAFGLVFRDLDLGVWDTRFASTRAYALKTQAFRGLGFGFMGLG